MRHPAENPATGETMNNIVDDKQVDEDRLVENGLVVAATFYSARPAGNKSFGAIRPEALMPTRCAMQSIGIEPFRHCQPNRAM
jgi:hypothetical protein